jgi:hypothetical protein
MARYSAFLGRRVEVHYRAGDIILPASGTFVADSGKSVFLEQHLVQRGLQKNFRWEIPYQYIVRLEEAKEPLAEDSASPASKTSRQDKMKAGLAREIAGGEDASRERNAVASSAAASSDTPAPILPISSPPKTA